MVIEKDSVKKSNWPKKAIQLPPGLHKEVVEKARQLRGEKLGLVSHVWIIAACMILDADEEVLKSAARNLRDHFDDGGDMDTAKIIVARHFDSPETLVKRVADVATEKPKPQRRRKAT